VIDSGLVFGWLLSAWKDMVYFPIAGRISVKTDRQSSSSMFVFAGMYQVLPQLWGTWAYGPSIGNIRKFQSLFALINKF